MKKLHLYLIALLLTALAVSCTGTGAYCGVDHRQDFGGTTVYYGAHAGTGGLHHNKKDRKKWEKKQKKLEKKREKARKEMGKQWKKRQKKAFRKHHDHHADYHWYDD